MVNKTCTGDLNIIGEVLINNNAILRPQAGGKLYIGGNWTDNKATDGFNEGSSTVEFNGSGNQSITSSMSETFYNLTVNNGSNTLTLNKDVTITGTATFTDGNLAINGQTLSLNGATSVGTGIITGSSTSNLSIGGTAAIILPKHQ